MPRKKKEQPDVKVLLETIMAQQQEIERLQGLKKSDDSRKIEVENLTESNVYLHSPDGKQYSRLLTPYGTDNCTAVVPERYWIWWKERGMPPIRLHEIRIKRYVIPEGEKIPEQWIDPYALSPDEILKLFKKKVPEFKKFVDGVEVADTLIRYWRVGEKLYNELMDNHQSFDEYPNLLAHLNYLNSRFIRMRKEDYGIVDESEREEDVISHSYGSQEIRRIIKKRG